GGLERLAGVVVREALSGELAQLVVDEWEQLGGGLGVAGLDGGEDLRDAGHAPQHTLAESEPRPETGHRSSLRHRTLSQSETEIPWHCSCALRASVTSPPGQASRVGGPPACSRGTPRRTP